MEFRSKGLHVEVTQKVIVIGGNMDQTMAYGAVDGLLCTMDDSISDGGLPRLTARVFENGVGARTGIGAAASR